MSTERTQWTPVAPEDSSAPRCQNCGTQVTRRFTRVFGNNADIANGCPNCRTYRELKTGARDMDGETL